MVISIDAIVGMMRGRTILTKLYEIGSMQYNRNDVPGWISISYLYI